MWVHVAETDASLHTASTVPTLSDLPEPTRTSPEQLASQPGLTPEQRVFFYSSDDWELFLRECATALAGRYVQVKRLGGTNDEGVDVAGFKSSQGFEGPWECWQGKHYADSLVPSDAMPEILKVLRHVLAGDYVMPDAYYFLAPKGCGSSLARMLSKPSTCRAHFLDKLVVGKPLAADVDVVELSNIRKFARTLDFAVFQSMDMQDLIELHAQTRWHQNRFGGTIRPRPPGPDCPPDDIEEHERRYVEQLVAVYREAHPADNLDVVAVRDHNGVSGHFRRQRVAFFSAEALRVHARDSVPPGTFEALQDDVYDGVIDVAEGVHPSGMARLQQVLTAAGQIDLSAHALVSVSKTRDRHGICHQLANDDLLSWLVEAP